jgi:23S rRNA (guanosine2251-2'-O)-methyltransferase
MNGIHLRLILDNLRSAGNVGSILRTADATGVELVYACGTTPYPQSSDDPRPAHIASSNQKAIAKTALGAEFTIPVKYLSSADAAMSEARNDGFEIIVIEQAETALNLFSYNPTTTHIAIVMGNEVDGVSPKITNGADTVLELPMQGQKESLNVAVATAIVLYHMRYSTR